MTDPVPATKPLRKQVGSADPGGPGGPGSYRKQFSSLVVIGYVVRLWIHCEANCSDVRFACEPGLCNAVSAVHKSTTRGEDHRVG